MGTYLRVFSKSFPMSTNVTWFRWFSKICDGKINVMPPLYFVLCRRAVSRYTKPTVNLPWMVIKLQTTRILIPQKYIITICIILLKKNLLIFKNIVEVFF